MTEERNILAANQPTVKPIVINLRDEMSLIPSVSIESYSQTAVVRTQKALDFNLLLILKQMPKA